MCVTLQPRFRSTLFCRSLRDATLSRPINASKNTFGIEVEITSFQVLFTESLACHGLVHVTFLGVAVVLTHHKLSTCSICDPPTVR